MQRMKNSRSGEKTQRAGDDLPAKFPNRPNAMQANPPGKTTVQVLLRNMDFQQKGIISKVDAQGELGRRIRDMGLAPGVPIEVQGRAPLSDPVAVKVLDCVLALRNNEADRIWVGVEEVRNE